MITSPIKGNNNPLSIRSAFFVPSLLWGGFACDSTWHRVNPLNRCMSDCKVWLITSSQGLKYSLKHIKWNRRCVSIFLIGRNLLKDESCCQIGLWQACRRQKCTNIFKTGVFFSFGVTLVLVVMVTDKVGQQQNNLLRAVSLLHRLLVHPQELSATSAFSLKTRHSRESEVPVDFGDLNSVKTAAGIFCLLQAKPIVCPRGRHTVFPPALFF